MHDRPDHALQLVLPGRREWPLFDVAATRAIEAEALVATPPHALMQRAGLATARLVLAAHPRARRVQLWAGPGNNGGDALVAATLLHRHGLRVRVTWLGDPARLPDDARLALDEARAAGVVIDDALGDRIDADVAVDGLLGIGVRRAPEGRIAAAIACLNRSGRPVVAIDLPSGLDADRGVAPGEAVVATDTLSLLTLKPGLFTAQGRDHVGRVWHDALGVALPASTDCLLGAPPTATPPHDAHKGRFGDVTVAGGDTGMAGAAVLAARAALAAGAGRVYLCALGHDADHAVALTPELMHNTLAALQDPTRLRTMTVVCGCGGGEAVRALLPPLLAHAARLVLDADALNAIAAETTLATALQHRAARDRPTILTPHPLEAARLLGLTAAKVQADRLACAADLARRFGAIVVLKGSGTVIASPDGGRAVNPTGNALLAAPGTGDVLAGWIGGAWSRAGPAARAVDVAAAAVWRHGRAADAAAARAPAAAQPARR